MEKNWIVLYVGDGFVSYRVVATWEIAYLAMRYQLPWPARMVISLSDGGPHYAALGDDEAPADAALMLVSIIFSRMGGAAG